MIAEIKEKIAGMCAEALLAYSNGPDDRAVMDVANEYANRIMATEEFQEIYDSYFRELTADPDDY